MGKVAFIADYFIDELPLGGAEQCNEVILSLLPFEVDKHKTENLTIEEVQDYDFLIISNHMNLSVALKEFITNNKRYIVIEHDFGCLITRDISIYEDGIAPASHLIDSDFYRNAKKVFLQSDPHLRAWVNNTGLPNLISLKANPYSEKDIESILSISKDVIKKEYSAILDHPFWQKNTKGSVHFCKTNNIKYEVIPRLGKLEYIKKLSTYSSLVFLPLVFESFSRVCCEAALCGLKIYSNQNISFTQSEYKGLKGEDLARFLLNNNSIILEKILREIA